MVARKAKGKADMNRRELESDLSSAPSSSGDLSDYSKFVGSGDEQVSIFLLSPRYLGCKLVPSFQTYA